MCILLPMMTMKMTVKMLTKVSKMATTTKASIINVMPTTMR